MTDAAAGRNATRHPDPVSVLTDVIAAAEHSSDAYGTMDVTLLVHGALVSGRIISEAVFLELLPQQWNVDKSDADATRSVSELVTTWKATSATWFETERPLAIHLRDAVLMLGQKSVNLGTPGLWRSPLREIGGYIFGRAAH